MGSGVLPSSSESRGTLLLYWDYELQRGADASRSGPKDWGLEDYKQTENLLHLLDDYDVKGTFACVGYTALRGELPYHAPEQIREMAERGHEVASHAWEHEWIPDLDPDELISVLKRSKSQLEEASGRSVISFAPPWNAPTKYMRKGAIGLYQRRRSKYDRVDIPTLCRALKQTGYKTNRVTYESIPQTLSRHLLRKISRKPTPLTWIEGLMCFRVNGGGFGDDSRKLLEKVSSSGGYAVVGAHPWCLVADNTQNRTYLEGFLEYVNRLRDMDKLVVRTPSEVYNDWSRTRL